MATRQLRLPEFDSLPLDPTGPAGNAWGLFGANDELGMLNLLTPAVVAEAAREIHDGTRFSLDWPLSKPAYPSFGRSPCVHQIVNRFPKLINDDVLTFNTQSSSQWDGFRHYGYQKERVLYNGRTLEDIQSSHTIGIDVWLNKGGIVGRGVLLDYAEWAHAHNIPVEPFTSTPIRLAHLQQLISEQNIEFRTGDILLIRSGFIEAYERLSAEEQQALANRPSPDFLGLEASEEVLRWIWSQEFSAVAGDAPSFERAPIAGPHTSTEPMVMLHQWLLAGWGLPIGELFDLEALSKHCKQTGRRSFFLASVPLKVPGGVASPPNAIAIF